MLIAALVYIRPKAQTSQGGLAPHRCLWLKRQLLFECTSASDVVLHDIRPDLPTAWIFCKPFTRFHVESQQSHVASILCRKKEMQPQVCMLFMRVAALWAYSLVMRLEEDSAALVGSWMVRNENLPGQTPSKDAINDQPNCQDLLFRDFSEAIDFCLQLAWVASTLMDIVLVY